MNYQNDHSGNPYQQAPQPNYNYPPPQSQVLAGQQPQQNQPYQQQPYQQQPYNSNPYQPSQQSNYPNSTQPNSQMYQQAPAPAHNYDIYPENQSTDPFLDGLSRKDIGLADFDERKGFIVKVYTLISLQLGMTFLLTLLAYLNKPFRDFLINPENGNLSAFSWVCFGVMFVTEIAIFCCKGVAKKVPNNYIALTLFTFCMSVLVAAICGTVYNFYEENGAFLVMAAALLTLAVTLSLTAYACTTKSDFTMMGGALWIIAAVLLVLAIISWFHTSIILQLLICGLVIVCYGFYLIYDTQLIVGGKTHELSIDDYIIAAMLIYIDIIILFLRILQIIALLFGKK